MVRAEFNARETSGDDSDDCTYLCTGITCASDAVFGFGLVCVCVCACVRACVRLRAENFLLQQNVPHLFQKKMHSVGKIMT